MGTLFNHRDHRDKCKLGIIPRPRLLFSRSERITRVKDGPPEILQLRLKEWLRSG